MKKVGFFGGCFNPPSNIHIKLANELILHNTIDKVIFVPVGNFYIKEDLIEAKHRVNMLKLAIEGEPNIEIDEIELKQNKNLYAIDVFKLLEEKYKNDDFYFIMGSDNYEKINTWKDYDILKKYKYIVLERKNEVSSTEIRQKIYRNEDVSYILNKKVLNYIINNNLYSRQ